MIGIILSGGPHDGKRFVVADNIQRQVWPVIKQDALNALTTFPWYGMGARELLGEIAYERTDTIQDGLIVFKLKE